MVLIPDAGIKPAEPILNPVTKAEHRVRIDMVDGFEYTLAEIGRGWTKVLLAVGVWFVGPSLR